MNFAKFLRTAFFIEQLWWLPTVNERTKPRAKSRMTTFIFAAVMLIHFLFLEQVPQNKKEKASHLGIHVRFHAQKLKIYMIYHNLENGHMVKTDLQTFFNSADPNLQTLLAKIR